MSENNDSKIVEGKLEAFYETGMEGTAWILHEDGKEGYDGIVPLENGQLLTVFNDKACTDVLWQGVVDLTLDRDEQSDLLEQNKYPGRLGPWGYGLPRNIHPYDWVKMFTQERPARLEAPAEKDSPKPSA